MHENNRSVNKLIFNKRVIVFSVFIPWKLCHWIGFEVEIILVYYLFMFYLELIEKMKKKANIEIFKNIFNISYFAYEKFINRGNYINKGHYTRRSEFSSYKIELRNRVKQKNITLRVTYSKIFEEILPSSY